MITLLELKVIAKQNKMCYSYMNKDEIIKLLVGNNMVTLSDIIKPKMRWN